MATWRRKAIFLVPDLHPDPAGPRVAPLPRPRLRKIAIPGRRTILRGMVPGQFVTVWCCRRRCCSCYHRGCPTTRRLTTTGSDLMPADADHIIATIRAQRGGTVTAWIGPREADVTLAEEFNALLDRVGYGGPIFWQEIVEDVQEVSRDQAAAILTSVLQRDLAYNCPIMDAAMADDLARQFLDLFAAGARYFTNCEFRYARDEESGRVIADLGSWFPLSMATFDTGIICVDSQRIGILWVEDED